MARHGKNEQERWRKRLDEIRACNKDWIDSIISAQYNTPEQQIENLIDTLMTWQQLSLQLFDTLELVVKHVDMGTVDEFTSKDYAHTYSNAVHNFDEAGVDNHTRTGVKTHLVENYD
jgi:hypothetical protein